MKKEIVYEMTNDFGKDFLDRYFSRVIIDGTERRTNDNRQEFYIIYRTECGKYVAVLPEKESKDDSSCFFGPLDYFAKLAAYDAAGMQAKWDVNDNPIHPKWYLRPGDARLDKWIECYRNILKKYSW